MSLRFPVKIWALGVVAFLSTATLPAKGHEMRPAFLELREGADGTWEMTWKVPARGADMRLALDVRLPDDCEWTSLPGREFTGDAFIDRGTFTRPGGLDGEEIYIEGLLSTFTDAMVQVYREDGSVQTARLEPSAPSFEIEARPDPAALPRLYFGFGLEYLARGWDHVALVLGLLALSGSLARFGPAFLTMILTASMAAFLEYRGLVAVSSRWTEIMLALGLLFLALAIVRNRKRSVDSVAPPSDRAISLWAGGVFGFVHGCAFAHGFAAVGVGNTGTSEALAFLGALVLGLGAVGLLGVALFRIPRRIQGIGKAFPRVDGARWRLASAYVLGVAGVFWTLQRW